MTTLSDKISFAETYIVNKEGRRFSLKGRDWVRDEFWLPADGFKLWRPEEGDPCEECLNHIGEITEHPNDNPTVPCKCGGLSAEPIIITVLNLHRQDGKTFSCMAYAMAALLKARNKSIAFLAASEDQAKALFRENYESAIKASPKLAKRCKIIGLRIEPTARNNRGVFEALSTSHKSVTGRTRTHLLIDEAKDIEARVAWELMPAISTMSGVECPRGHVQLTKEEAIGAPDNCAACGERLTPWYGRLVIASSSGVVDETGKETDWLHEFIELIKKQPHKNVHVFQSDHALNPAKDDKIVGALESTFGQLDSMAHYVDAGLSNVWRRKGKDALSKADMRRCEDPRLENEHGTTNPCVAFLDTSTVLEKTSLVILADDPSVASAEIWDHVYMSRLDFWTPADLPGGVIDDVEVFDRLDGFLHLFTNLRAFGVDTRGQPWAVRLVRKAKADRKLWAKKIISWDKKDDVSQMGWRSLIKRYLDQTIRVQDHPEIRKELRGVMMRQSGDGPPKVVDRNRKRVHKDITEGMACCCWLIEEQIAHGGRRGMADVHGRSSAATAVSRIGRGRQSKLPGRLKGDWY